MRDGDKVNQKVNGLMNKFFLKESSSDSPLDTLVDFFSFDFSTLLKGDYFQSLENIEEQKEENIHKVFSNFQGSLTEDDLNNINEDCKNIYK